MGDGEPGHILNRSTLVCLGRVHGAFGQVQAASDPSSVGGLGQAGMAGREPTAGEGPQGGWLRDQSGQRVGVKGATWPFRIKRSSQGSVSKCSSNGVLAMKGIRDLVDFRIVPLNRVLRTLIDNLELVKEKSI